MYPVSPKGLFLRLRVRNNHPRSSHPRSNHLRNNYSSVPKTNNYKKKFFCSRYKNSNLSLNKLKLIAKSRGIKDYKSKSEDELIKTPSKTKPKIEETRKQLNKSRDKFSRSKRKKIRQNPYE